MEYRDFLDMIVKGIPDTIKVYDKNRIIQFCNKNEINCKEICEHDEIIEAIEIKEMVETQKYIPSINKFMEISYNTILNDLGEVIFIIERQRDITDKITLANTQKKIENNFKNLVSSPSFAVIILVNDGIAFASEGGKKVLGEAGENIIGRNIYTFFDKEDRKTARHRIKYILNNKIEDISHEYSILVGDNRRIDLELSSGYFLYNNSEAIRVEIRNISRIKKELNIAAKYQKASLQKKFPIEGKVKMERIFLPCKIVSGDFYKIHKIDENNVVGIIWDATGKGLSAALNVNVLEFLFVKIVEKSKKPLEVINMLNKKIMENFEENYIAACCFSFDFKSKQVNVVGAGINQFLMQKRNGIVEEVEVKGTPLGMFSNSYFSEKTFSIESGDRFFFFTDGLEFLLDTDKVIQRYMGKVSIKDIKKFLAQYTDELLFSTEGLKDDCTMLALEILDGF